MNQTEQRRYYIDWIRVLAFFILIFFHCAMPFVTFNWEVKNSDTSVALSRLIWWLHQWRIPLLFFIAGAGIHFSLIKRNIPAFAGERIVRLFIPLLFAMFFTIPLQVYVEKLQAGKIHGSYIDFYPTVWNGIPYPEGTLTWSHMWFVVYLFVFCLLLLPIFAIFRIKKMQEWKQQFASWISSNVIVMMLPALPFMAYYFCLYLEYPEQQSLLDDWFLFSSSFTFLFWGYILGGNDKFWDKCTRYRFIFLSIFITASGYLLWKYWWDMQLPDQQGAALSIYGIINSILTWSGILAIAGMVKKYLNYSSSLLRYCSEAVYPFYILHQTIIVVAGYFVVQWNAGIAVKLAALIIICFITVFAIYRWLIKPFIITRLLFGMKTKDTKL